jgi:hypothetical protein
MIKEDRFMISRRPYAVKLGTYKTESRRMWVMGKDSSSIYHRSRIDAVWFRRRKGVTVACAGHLSTGTDGPVSDPVRFLQGYTDGRYGGTCSARWDGERLWLDPSILHVNPYLGILRPMLKAFPDVPDGYDGWWTFHGG